MIEKKHYFLPGDKKVPELLTEIIRVDHSGELGAKVIYQGQILATKSWHHKQKELLIELNQLYKTELEHYNYFDQLLKTKRVRPSFLIALWQVLGFALGYFSALLGTKMAMATTVAIEEVIADHYLEQLEILKRFSEKDLQSKIEQFLGEEVEHLKTGLNWEATSLKGYSYYKKIIKISTKTAIYLAKRL
jgi:ubiquinone biosynthesis monooxygenase Coq7